MRLQITIRSNGTVLADRAEFASGLVARMKGLLGRDSLAPGGGLVISPCVSVHTFGMRFPIDLVFYGRDNRVLATVERLRPYRVSCLSARAAGVIELPAGTLEDAGLKAGDELGFHELPAGPA